MNSLSDKQAKLLNKIIEPKESEIYVQGSVQSGKTYVIALSVIFYAKALYEYDPNTKYNGAIIGWDIDAVTRNIVEVIQNFMDMLGYDEKSDYTLKLGTTQKYFEFLNIRFYFFGFNTKLSFNKILGGPMLFIWVDESARIYSNSTLQQSFDEIPRTPNEFCRTSV